MRDGGGPDERKFAEAQISNFAQIARRYTWRPWREGAAQAPEGSEDDDSDNHDIDEGQLARWRLKCDMMRVATYYRVTGARARAEARIRNARARTRFREWIRSVIQARQNDAAEEQAVDQAQDSSRETRKRRMAPGAYCETRTNKQRATQEEVTTRRLQAKRRRRGATASDTQVGKRLRDEMSVIATRSVRQRRERIGDG